MKNTKNKKIKTTTIVSGAALVAFLVYLNKDKIKKSTQVYFEKISTASGIPIENLKNKLQPATWNNLEHVISIIAKLTTEYMTNEKSIKYDVLAKEIVKWTTYISEMSNAIYNKPEIKSITDLIVAPKAKKEIEKFLKISLSLQKMAKENKLSKNKNIPDVVKYKILEAINDEYKKVKTVKAKKVTTKKVATKKASAKKVATKKTTKKNSGK